MKPNILVLGSTGMLGHMVLRYLRYHRLAVQETHLRPEDSFYFNVFEGIGGLDSICRSTGPYDVAINCIGMPADKIRNDAGAFSSAIKINSLFPHELASFAAQRGMRVLHISTDGVFSGAQGTCFEDSPQDCTDFYGKTKSIGEVTRQSCFLNIRCSIVGPSPYEKGGLLEWFLSQPDGSTLSGYANHLWNGVTTLQFADFCFNIIADNLFDAIRSTTSIVHFSPNETVSKYKLLECFREAYGKDLTIVPVNHAGGTVQRVLKSKCDIMNGLYGTPLPMLDAVMQLKTTSAIIARYDTDATAAEESG